MNSNIEELNGLNLSNEQKNEYRRRLRAELVRDRRRPILNNARRAANRRDARERTAAASRDATRFMASVGEQGLVNMWKIFDEAFKNLDGKLLFVTLLAALNYYFGEKVVNKMLPNLTNVASSDILTLMKDDKIVGRIEKFKIYFKPGYKSVHAFTTALLFMVLLRSVVIWSEKSTKVKAMLRWVFSQKWREMALGVVTYKVCVWGAAQTFFDIAKILLTGTEYKSEYKILKNSDAFTKVLVYLKIVTERAVGVTSVNVAFNKFRKLSQGAVVRSLTNMLGWVMDLPIVGPLGRDAILGKLASVPLRRLLGPPNNNGGGGNATAGGKVPVINIPPTTAVGGNLNSARRTTRQLILTANSGERYRFQNQRDLLNLQRYNNGGAMGSTDTILRNNAGQRYRVTTNQLRAAIKLRPLRTTRAGTPMTQFPTGL